MTLYVITNGTVLTDEVREFMSKNKGRLSVILSLDGNRDVHNKNRRNSFDRIMDNLDFMHPHITSVNMVVTPETIFQLHESIHFFRSIDIPRVSVLPQNGIDWDNTFDFDKFKEYFLDNCLGLTELKEVLAMETTKMCHCGEDIFVDEIGELFICSNFTTEENKIGDIYQGIDFNKVRPFLVGKDRDTFCCLLKNREQNGSIFDDHNTRNRFTHFYFDLVRMIDSK